MHNDFFIFFHNFSLLKAIIEVENFSLSTLRSRKSDNYRCSDSWKRDNLRNSNKEKTQRTDKKNKKAKKFKNDNFKRSNKFWGHNNIFKKYIFIKLICKAQIKTVD